MKNKKYKTLNGLTKAATYQIRVSDILNGKMTVNGKYCNVVLEGDALQQFATMLGNYLYTTKERSDVVVNAVINRSYCDASFLQCFYLCKGSKKFYINNSLSGEAFNYCRRNFMKSIL